MRFDVSIQGTHYTTMEAPNTGEALAQVARDIAAGLVPGFDASQNHNVVITPAGT